MEAAEQAETAAAGMSKPAGGIVGMINNIVTSWGGMKAAASKINAGEFAPSHSAMIGHVTDLPPNTG